MRKIAIIVLMHLVAVCAMAETKSAQIISKMSAQIGAMGTYSVRFSIHVGERVKEGVYVVSGERYVMDEGEVRVLCDGKNRYEINRINREVLVDVVDQSKHDVFSNPVRAFDFMDESFESSYAGQEKVGGKSCHVISLLPKDGESMYQNIVVVVSEDTNMPMELRYKTDAISEDIVIKVLDFSKKSNMGADKFKFKRSDYKDYEIIDFR